MIPPGLITKAAELLAPVGAKLSKPLVKWGLIGGVVVALMVTTWWQTYDHLRTKYEAEKIAAIQAATAVYADEARKQQEAERALNIQISEEREQKTRELERLLADARKKARKYANVKIQVPVDILRVHDQYAGMSEGGADRPSTTDPRSSGTEVSRGAVPAQADQRVSVTLGELGTVEMTLESAVNMLSDVYDTLQRMDRDYSKFSQWNDGREVIEHGLVNQGKD